MNEVKTEANGNLMYIVYDKGDRFLMQTYRLREDDNFKWVGEKSFDFEGDAVEAGREYIGYADRWAYINVHHSEEWDCWLVTAYNSEDDQIGDSETEYRKADAVDTAQAYLDTDRCDAIFIYNKTGEMQSSRMGRRVTGGNPFGGDE